MTQAPSGGLYPVTVEYQVAYRNGVQTGASDDLDQAMDILAPQVAAETFPDPRRRLMYGRRLTVGVQSTQLTGSLPVSGTYRIGGDPLSGGTVSELHSGTDGIYSRLQPVLLFSVRMTLVKYWIIPSRWSLVTRM